MSTQQSGLSTHNITPNAKFGYIPGLDGIRAIAVLIVLIAHVGWAHIVPGGFGVTIFFFISGFLITRLLLAESEKKGKIGLKDFYIRRFLRLLPALYLMLVLTWGYMATIGKSPSIGEAIGAFTYTMNYHYAYMGAYPGVSSTPWSHLWSLAVEEHFYLMFPLLLLFVKQNWAKAFKIGLGVCIGVLCWRLFTHNVLGAPHEYTYATTDSRLDSIMYGCLLSLGLHVWPNHKIWNRLIGAVPITIALLTIFLSFAYRADFFRDTFRYSVQGISLFVLVLNLMFWPQLKFAVRVLETKIISWIGRVSYGIYLWHVPFATLALEQMGMISGTAAYVTFVVIGTFVLTYISYYGMEKPIVKLRKKFGSHTREDGKKMEARDSAKTVGSNTIPSPAE